MVKKKQKPSSGDTHASRTGISVKKSIRMKFAISSEINPVFANQMLVQSDETTTYLSFFVVQPPVLLGSEDEVKKQIDDLEEVSAKMIAQVIVPRDRMENFIETLQTAVKREPSLKAMPDSRSDTSSHS
jgi:hypothetical protein